MASTYPTTIDVLTDPAGTQTLGAGDHSGLHATVNDALEKIEAVMGTTSGTSVLKNLVAGKFAASDDGGTINNAVMGTPRITAGTVTNGTINTSLFSNGTINTTTFGTPTILGGTIAISGTAVPLTFGAGIAPTVTTVSDAPSGTVTPNAQAQQVYSMAFGTSAGNRTITTPINPTDGQSLTFRIKTSGSQNGTIVWGTAFRFSNALSSSLYGSAKWNYYSFRYNGSDSIWDYQGESNSL